MRDQVKTLIIFAIVLAALGIYAVVPLRLTYADVGLRKISLLADASPSEPSAAYPSAPAGSPSASSDGLSASSFGQGASAPSAEKPRAKQPLAGPVRILFIGDSMLEELSRRLDDYAVANGHTLQTVVWYGSTTEKWGMTQTLRHLVAEYKPTYLWVCLGGNELFVRDLEERDAYIKLLLAQAGDLPLVWIGPPNWKQDTGINDLIRHNVGEGSFFDSSQLTLKRKKDGRHPTHQAAAEWGDEVAAWMQSTACDQPLTMRRPDKAARCPMRLLQPAFAGFDK